MSKPEMDLQAIRAKLLSQQQQLGQPPVDEPPLDWSVPRSSPGRSGVASGSTVPPTAPSPQLLNAVETLQQRASQSLAGPPSGGIGATSFANPAPPQISFHQQRLQSLAEQINEWSDRQEQAMLEMKSIVERLEREQRRQQVYADGSGALVQIPPAVDFEAALVAIADQDDQGNLALTYRPVDLHQADREATDLAQTLRSRSQPYARRARRDVAEPGFQTLLAEPLNNLRLIGQVGVEIGLEIWDRMTEAFYRMRSHHSASPFPLMDGIIWFVGGIISRLALNLILTAYPGLWSLAVAAVTAMTAYALYRATLAPRLEFGLAYRVLLAIAGLLVGGRLF